jgi:hypothetical protein
MIDFKTTEMLQSAELKAALYAGGNLSKLVRNAIQTYSESLPQEVVEKTLSMDIQGYNVTVLNVPYLQLEGEIHENLILSATLERIIEQKIKEAPLNTNSLEFNFKELLN